MLDIKLLRTTPQVVRKDIEKRKDTDKLKVLDITIEYDKEWLDLKKEIDELRRRRNAISIEISEMKKKGVDAAQLLKEAGQIPRLIEHKEKRIGIVEAEVKKGLFTLPNMLHETVPYGAADTDNVTVRTFGKKPTFDF